MNRGGSLLGLVLWIIITVFLCVVGFVVFPYKVYNYVSYSLITISLSTCFIIGMYLLNKDNLIIQKLLKIDIVWLFVGIFLTIFEILWDNNYSYNIYLPLLIYLGRLLSIYIDIAKISNQRHK
ncbi:hypothetical protein ACO3VM_06105 [Methanocaldococcus sp. 10A]